MALRRYPIEIAGTTVLVELRQADAALLGCIATMLAEAVEERGPCILTPECNGGPEIPLELGGAVRVILP